VEDDFAGNLEGLDADEQPQDEQEEIGNFNLQG